jgi:hypothetical protein
MIKRALLALVLLGTLAACNSPSSSPSPTTPSVESPPAVESLPAESPSTAP